MTQLPSTSKRLDYLDAVRAYALLLGIVFHASLSFMPIFIGWAVMDISTSDWIPIFVFISHSFRMPLFFLIAGFFSYRVFIQGDVSSFLKSRLMRLVAPFILGWLLLRPLMLSAWTMGAESMRGEVNIGDALLAGLDAFNGAAGGLFIGTHLWFLYYLILISISVIAVCCIINLHAPIKDRVGRFIDSGISWICGSYLAIFMTIVPTAACLWFMTHWGIDTPDKSLSPVPSVTFLYAMFFTFGWLLSRQPKLLDTLSIVTIWRVFLCALSIIAAVILSRFEAQLAHPDYMLIKLSFVVSYAAMMWSLIAITIGLAKRLFNRPSKTIRYVADASYWLYLIHLPMVIVLQVTVAELAFPWWLKLISICASTLLFSLLAYDIMIRPTWVGAMLNGKRKPGALFNYIKQLNVVK